MQRASRLLAFFIATVSFTRRLLHDSKLLSHSSPPSSLHLHFSSRLQLHFHISFGWFVCSGAVSRPFSHAARGSFHPAIRRLFGPAPTAKRRDTLHTPDRLGSFLLCFIGLLPGVRGERDGSAGRPEERTPSGHSGPAWRMTPGLARGWGPQSSRHNTPCHAPT